MNSIGQTVFELESGNENVDKQMDGQTDKNGQTNERNFTNFERNLAMMVVYLPVNFEFDWTNRFRVKSPETKMWTEGWTEKWTKNGQKDRKTDKRTNGITPISKGI